jgi:hypothetical protein
VTDGRDEPLEQACPRCGEQYEAYQEYCLECGARLPGSYTFGRTVSTGGPSQPWLWATLAALLLVALVAGAIVAIAASGDDEERGGISGASGTLSGTEGFGGTGLEPVPAGTGAGEAPPPPPGGGAETGGDGGGGGGAAGGGGQTAPIEWPAGQDGFTVVLASVAAEAGRGGATAVARQAIEAGVPDVGVLDSSEFSSLRPGYYVVFSGVYGTIGEAEAALPVVRSSGYELAYPREIAT